MFFCVVSVQMSKKEQKIKISKVIEIIYKHAEYKFLDIKMQENKIKFLKLNFGRQNSR